MRFNTYAEYIWDINLDFDVSALHFANYSRSLEINGSAGPVEGRLSRNIMKVGRKLMDRTSAGRRV